MRYQNVDEKITQTSVPIMSPYTADLKLGPLIQVRTFFLKLGPLIQVRTFFFEVFI